MTNTWRGYFTCDWEETLTAQIREKIIQEEASKKASEAAKRQRDLKKFGKQVQVTKLQDRQKEKTATLDKIKALKRSNLTFHHQNEILTCF